MCIYAIENDDFGSRKWSFVCFEIKLIKRLQRGGLFFIEALFILHNYTNNVHMYIPILNMVKKINKYGIIKKDKVHQLNHSSCKYFY